MTSILYINYYICHRQFVTTIYKPPQISEDEEVGDLLQEYMGDFRRVYIEHPRVRYDGVYIAVCHYMYVDISYNIPIIFRTDVSHAVGMGSARTLG